MHLIVGATSRLGRPVARRLRERGRAVRAMTRDPARAADLAALGVEVVRGDLRDPASLEAACRGATKVLASAHGFDGKDGNTPRSVDGDGNAALVDAARRAGVERLVLVSVIGAAADSPVELFREKHRAERHLAASGVPFSVVRASAFMEFWAAMVGGPILREGKVTIFGRGENPVNFVSVDDVARHVLHALDDPGALGRTVDVGGPENLGMNQVASLFEALAGRPSGRTHVPLPLMRFLAWALRPVNPALARQIAAGVFMDTADLRFDVARTLAVLPGTPTRLEEVARRLAASERPRAQPAVRR